MDMFMLLNKFPNVFYAKRRHIIPDRQHNINQY